jgi:hypothetical protein
MAAMLKSIRTSFTIDPIPPDLPFLRRSAL